MLVEGAEALERKAIPLPLLRLLVGIEGRLGVVGMVRLQSYILIIFSVVIILIIIIIIHLTHIALKC